MTSIGTIKAGDTFGLLATINNEENNLVIGESANLKSQVRTSDDELIAELTVRETDDGTYLFEFEDTSLWPITILYLDIQYSKDGVVTSSNTLSVKVLKDVTKEVIEDA